MKKSLFILLILNVRNRQQKLSQSILKQNRSSDRNLEKETSESVVASPFNGFVKTLSIPRKPLMTDYFPIPRADAMPGIVFGRF